MRQSHMKEELSFVPNSAIVLDFQFTPLVTLGDKPLGTGDDVPNIIWTNGESASNLLACSNFMTPIGHTHQDTWT